MVRKVLENIGIKRTLDELNKTAPFRFNLFELLVDLVSSMILNGSSKYKSYFEIIPMFRKSILYSYFQLLRGLNFIGKNNQQILAGLFKGVNDFYKYDLLLSYFDCTNFYFEIDKESGLRMKGPSKEGRMNPIIGYGLLLDSNAIPVWMTIFAGNQSEKPILLQTWDNFEKSTGIKRSRTIHIADKGLNCSKNIKQILDNKDGYIFSQSLKLLKREKVNKYLNDDTLVFIEKYKEGSIRKLEYKFAYFDEEVTYTYIDEETGEKVTFTTTQRRVLFYSEEHAKKELKQIDKIVEKVKKMTVSEYKHSKYKDKATYIDLSSVDSNGEETGEKPLVKLNYDKIEWDKKLAGYNMFITSETYASGYEIWQAYSNLWKIEDTFRIMKTNLNTRPIFVRKEDTINGHFLISYIATLVLRLIQIKHFKNELTINEILKGIRSFNIVEIGKRKLNLSKKTKLIVNLYKNYALNIDNRYLRQKDIHQFRNIWSEI